MLKKLILAALFVTAATVGALLAHLGERTTIAGTENLHWAASTFVGSHPNQIFCFGTQGWHDGGSAADLFADSGGLCDDPDGAPNDVWAATFGKTDIWPTYYLWGWAADGNSIYTNCDDVYVDVWQYRTGGWVKIGVEWIKHVTSTMGSGQEFIMYIGQGYWAYSYTPARLGVTRYPDQAGCANVAYHAHQMVHTPSMIVSWSTNPSLVGNGFYFQQNVNNFIHNWTGW